MKRVPVYERQTSNHYFCNCLKCMTWILDILNQRRKAPDSGTAA